MLEVNRQGKNIDTDLIYRQMVELVGHAREPIMFEKCLPPCTSMKMVLKQSDTWYESNIALLDVKSREFATVHTQAYLHYTINKRQYKQARHVFEWKQKILSHSVLYWGGESYREPTPIILDQWRVGRGRWVRER